MEVSSSLLVSCGALVVWTRPAQAGRRPGQPLALEGLFSLAVSQRLQKSADQCTQTLDLLSSPDRVACGTQCACQHLRLLQHHTAALPEAKSMMPNMQNQPGSALQCYLRQELTLLSKLNLELSILLSLLCTLTPATTQCCSAAMQWHGRTGKTSTKLNKQTTSHLSAWLASFDSCRSAWSRSQSLLVFWSLE